MTVIDDYIAKQPENAQPKLKVLRGLVREAIGHAEETLKWNQPAFVDPDGMILVIFAGYKQHMNLVVTPSTKDAFSDRLKDYETGKGSLKLPYDKPLPADLIKDMVAYRANEYRQDGVKWK